METKKEASIRMMKHLRETNYAIEKTPEQRALRSIKRKSRWWYPLKDVFCIFCGEPATEHHHTTDPITVDDFVFMCHNCHYLLHYDLKVGTKDGKNKNIRNRK